MDADYLNSTVTPTLTEALALLTRFQPQDPIEWLGKYLVTAADALERQQQQNAHVSTRRPCVSKVHGPLLICVVQSLHPPSRKRTRACRLRPRLHTPHILLHFSKAQSGAFLIRPWSELLHGKRRPFLMFSATSPFTSTNPPPKTSKQISQHARR
jgi:hypothetical protein